MLPLITLDAREKILSLAEDNGVYVTKSHSDGAPFYIFEDWRDVEKLYQIGIENITVEDLDDLTMDDFLTLRPKANHAIDWIVGGEWSFSDSYTTCAHCYGAISTEYGMYWFDQHAGEYICSQCLIANKDFQEEYLLYCAQSWQDTNMDGEIADRHFADPILHDWVWIGGAESNSDWRNHDSFPHDMEYAKHEDLETLYKANRIIDRNLLILTRYSAFGQAYEFWAKWADDSDYAEADHSAAILEYAISRIYAKYRGLKYGDKR